MVLSEIQDAGGTTKRFVFRTQYDTAIPEDQRFFKYTPDGTISLLVDNPAVLAQWQVGKHYYFDAHEVPSVPAG